MNRMLRPCGLRDGEPITPKSAGFTEYGHLKKFCIDTSSANQKRVLVTGAGSYIGENFKTYAQIYYSENFQVDTLNMHGDDWRHKDFSDYDCILHVVGIAHADIGHVSKEMKNKYYSINTDLAIEVAKKAKQDHVKQFVFMSSMIIYGESGGYKQKKIIGPNTLPEPANFYGDSKWQADKGIRNLANENFHVAVIRPPMIYGKGSKGNYPKLAKLGKKIPIFPDIKNERSMLYVENLCEFLCKLVLSGKDGIYFPQNNDYIKTSELVKNINRQIYLHGFLNPLLAIASCFPGRIGRLTNKAFGNFVYKKEMSVYDGLDYIMYDLHNSIERAEGRK